ncbi:unnamed protein product [Clonostachys rosea]|uniref:mitogen-activated protein kinase n=1 Tax=Bionectria ochroleuca TaxID=29856 RepID=A0ABY6U1R0_BIOOC|nr:unnamed protein product [Clonostachys rosea]
MSAKRDSFLSFPTKKWRQRLGLELDDDKIQSKVFKATPNNIAFNDLSRFSEVVRLTSSGSEKALKTLKAVHRVILTDRWNVAYKGLQLLNYLLHYGGGDVLPWVIRHLKSLEDFAWNLSDPHHKRVLIEQLTDIRFLVENNRQLNMEREDPLHNAWRAKVTRPPPARPNQKYVVSDLSCEPPMLEPEDRRTGLERKIDELGEEVKRAIAEMTEGEHDAYISDEETDHLGATQPSKAAEFESTQVSMLGVEDTRDDLARQINELHGKFKRTVTEMTEGYRANISDEEASQLLTPATPIRGSSIAGARRLDDEEISARREGIRIARAQRQQMRKKEQERRFNAASEAQPEELHTAEERGQQVSEEQPQLAETELKRDMEIQRRQEAKSEDPEGHDEPAGEASMDNSEDPLMPREDTQRYITANTPKGDDLQVVDILPQSTRPRAFDGREEDDSRKQTLVRGGETPIPSTEEGTATARQMPQQRQTELLGHLNDRHQTPSPQLKVQRQQTPGSDLSVSSSRIVSDLVRDSKLETAFAPNGQVVRHVSYVTNPRMRRRRVRKEEIWERQSELGSGAFGRVWLEKCLTGDDIGKLRAVKEITKLQRQSRSSEIDYNRELEAIAKFSHKKSFGWYESEGAIYIAMEYLEHGDLQSHLNRPFPEDEVRDIVFQLLEGLSFMHENGFAHRDLKPANILVSEHSPNWWVKISDFGISKRAEEEATAFRTLVGTRGYIAPEVIGIYCPEDIDTILDSSSLYTVAVDLWALGAIMFKLLTHETIFAEPLELARYVTARRPFPRALVSEKGVSEACMGFLEQAMAHSPTSRPSSSQALAHEWLADLSNQGDSSDEFPEGMSASTGVLTGPFTAVAGESTASAAWPSTFS